MAFLSRVNIAFNTHNDDRHDDTVLHVFVKNRINNSSDPEGASAFTGNLMAWQRHLAAGNTEINPYLACKKAVSVGHDFSDPSTHNFDLDLRAANIRLEDIILPVVNIHIFPNGSDRWIFDYIISFFFSDGRSFSFASNFNGIKGIILDQNNNNYSGITTENPFAPLPQIVKPATNALLKRVILDFGTHDDAKNASTTLNVHIVNRVSATDSKDIAIGLDMFKNIAFPNSDPAKDDSSKKTFIFSADTHPLAAPNIRLQDMVLPQVFIIIVPNGGDDQWIFDYRVTYEFDNGHSYSSRTNGIILNQAANKHVSVYNGSPFPTVTPATAPATTRAPFQQVKWFSLNFIQKKLDEFINTRQGGPLSPNPPMVKFQLNNSGRFSEDTLPESYMNTLSINAIRNGVEYLDGPSSLGQLNSDSRFSDIYFNTINSKSLTINIDRSTATPFLTLKIDFDCSGSNEIVGGHSTSVGGMDLQAFSVSLKLTLDLDPVNHKIDVMSWVNAIEKETDDDRRDNLKNAAINVYVHAGITDFGGTFADTVRDKIYSKLITPDIITRRTVRDSINSSVNSILLGGAVDDRDNLGVPNPNNVVVSNVQVQGDNLMVTYAGPTFSFNPVAPANWPNAATNPNSPIDFSPGKLAHIDHIVVLTMENRSFDHMLGYLSLPVNKGGLGRTDVDGLKGGEFNAYNGTNYPSFPLTDTYFAPDPPHGYEPVNQAINGGKMDGFVKSYGDEHGDAIAGNIMGYHTAANVPVYDALARDFGIAHRWFASHPGPTFCNRFYELSGRLNIDGQGFWEFSNSASKRPAFTKTIFDHLTDYQHINSNITWKYFEHSYCFLRFFEKHSFDHTNIVDINDQETGFFASARSGNLPSVSFIDPHFIEFPPNANCDGPPADIQFGQQLVQRVVEAVVASPAWSKTLLIVTYDEHGGFFDHVPPVPAVKVSDESPIATTGVRVPAFFISPWVGQAQVFGHDATAGSPALYFDHTSILKSIARRFMSDYPPYMGARFAAAKDLTEVMNDTPRQNLFRPFIRYNILYNASQKSMDVQGASTAPGTVIWQYDVNDTEAQHFSFEDAGDGYYYIRTHRGNLYLTVDVPQEVITVGNIVSTATAVAPTAPASPTATTPAASPAAKIPVKTLTGPFIHPVQVAASPGYGVKQDVKYHGGKVVIADNRFNPGYQKWKLGGTAEISVLNANINFVISNAMFPGKVLQPVNNLSGAALVLGDPDPTNTILINHNLWKITSPLISNSVVATTTS